MDGFFIKKTPDANDLPLPQYQSELSAAMDLYANIENEEIINPMEIKLVKTGIQIEMPQGFEAQIRPRSGLALKNGIAFVNSPGTIDADYRGEIAVIMINLSKEPFVIKRGDRIAQMVINEIKQVHFTQTSKLSETKRGEGGFGHTGVSK